MSSSSTISSIKSIGSTYSYTSPSYTSPSSNRSSTEQSTEQLPILKLDPSALVKHAQAQSSRTPDVSRQVFINSWLDSQTELEIIDIVHEDQEDVDEESEDQESKTVTYCIADDSSLSITAAPSVPVIVLTGTDEDANADSSTHVVPTINISEPEDLQATQSVEAMKLIEKPTGFRPRAKSYPAIEQQLTPMLELPQRVNQRSIKSLATNATLSNKERAELNLSKYAHIVVAAKKWKNKAKGAAVQNLEVEATATSQRRRPFIEIPRALRLEVLEDAYPIVQKTYQMYKSYLGPKHKLSVLAEQHLERLNVQLGKT